MKKILSTFLLSIVFCVNLAPATIYAGTLDAGAGSGTKMIASDGVFTSYESTTRACSSEDGVAQLTTLFSGSTTSLSESGSTEEEEDAGFAVTAITDTVAEFLSGVVNVASSVSCDMDSSTGIGLFSQIYIFSEPVNVTNVQGLMAVTGIVQWIALTIMVFGILFYGYNVTMGKVEIDPFKFAARYLMSMVLVYYSPYFVQDILNLNNQIVDALGRYSLTIASGVTANITTILPMSFVGFIKSVGELVNPDGSGGGLALMTLVIMLIVLVMCFIPLLKLVVWWYVRLFKIFLYTAISPLMFASLCIENTAKTGFNFIRNFIHEVFSQMFVVLAIFVTGAFIAQLPTIMTQTNMGIVGLGIALYAALSFLHEVPGLASKLMDGDVSGGSGIASGFRQFRDTLGERGKRFGQTANRAAAMGKGHGTWAGTKTAAKGFASDMKKSVGSARIRGHK